MKTSWNNTIQIEKYLEGSLSAKERFLFEAELLINRKLRENMYFQAKTLQLVKLYHRKKMREELEVIHNQLFLDPKKSGFQQVIHQLFKTEK